MLVKYLENAQKSRAEYLLYIKKWCCMPRNKKKTPLFRAVLKAYHSESTCCTAHFGHIWYSQHKGPTFTLAQKLFLWFSLKLSKEWCLSRMTKCIYFASLLVAIKLALPLSALPHAASNKLPVFNFAVSQRRNIKLAFFYRGIISVSVIRSWRSVLCSCLDSRLCLNRDVDSAA